MKFKAYPRLYALAAGLLLVGCAGQTDQTTQPGAPIGDKYQAQLNQLQIGQTTPAELQEVFNNKATLKEKGSGYEIWEIVKPGDLDDRNFLMWGVMDRTKDQSLLFRFKKGVLVSYTSGGID
jgi:hypothetical protein